MDFKNWILTGFCICSLTLLSICQSPAKKRGKISWHAPKEVLELEKSTRRPSLQSGYRIQIFLGSLEDAKKFRQQYILQHPNAMIYISQNIPDYVLRYGNFLSKNEARMSLKEIRKEIPSAIIVDDMVEPVTTGLPAGRL